MIADWFGVGQFLPGVFLQLYPGGDMGNVKGMVLFMFRNNYIHLSVSSQSVHRYFADNLSFGNDIHAIEIYENNELMLHWAPAPYSCDEKCEVYSLSKSFTSTAIGIAVAQGLISVENRVVDIFPDKAPACISENLRAMKIRHLLSMNTGHKKDMMPVVFCSADGVETFLAQKVPYEPGSHFAYNTAASYMLAAIIARVTGLSVLDYLAVHLFHLIGIEDVSWRKCAGDVCEGGTGITISCDDISKLGRLYLNGGVLDGVRYLPEEWVKEASSFHSDNSDNGSPDWQSGYGYQFWMNAWDGYRGDGAYGQLCMILPKHNMVVAVQAETCMMQEEIDCIVKLVKELHQEQKSAVPAFTAYPLLPQTDDTILFANTSYRCNENPFGFTWVELAQAENRLELRFGDGTQMQTLAAGKSSWEVSQFDAKFIKPKLTDIMLSANTEKIKMAACYTVKDGKVEILCRHLNTPHVEHIIISADRDSLRIDFQFSFELLQSSAKYLTAEKVL